MPGPLTVLILLEKIHWHLIIWRDHLIFELWTVAVCLHFDTTEWRSLGPAGYLKSCKLFTVQVFLALGVSAELSDLVGVGSGRVAAHDLAY